MVPELGKVDFILFINAPIKPTMEKKSKSSNPNNTIHIWGFQILIGIYFDIKQNMHHKKFSMTVNTTINANAYP